MEKNITEHVLKISGKATLLDEIDDSHNYQVLIDGSITSTTDESNEDGTYARYYKFKPIKVSVLKETGETIKSKDTRSRSQQLRSVIARNWDNQGRPIEKEEYYDERMMEIIKHEIERGMGNK